MRRIRTTLTVIAISLAFNCLAFGQNSVGAVIPLAPTTNPLGDIEAAPATRPILSVSEAMELLKDAQAVCLTHLQSNGDYSSAMAQLKQLENDAQSAGADNAYDAAQKVLAAKTTIRQLEAKAFAADAGVVQAKKSLDNAKAAKADMDAQDPADAADAAARAARDAAPPQVSTGPQPEQVKIGMTLAQVESVMGGPGHLAVETTSRKVYQWHDSGGDLLLTIGTQDGKVISLSR